MACESIEKPKGSALLRNDPFTIGVISSGHEQDSDFLHHKNRSIKEIKPFYPMGRMENLSDIKFKDSDEKEGKSQNQAQQFSIDLGSLNDFVDHNVHCSGFISNDVSGLKHDTTNGGDSQLLHPAQVKQDLKFPDISAIQSNSDGSFLAEHAALKSSKEISEEKGLQSLHRNLMPAIIVQVGSKQVRMPRLDIERVIALEDRPLFLNNLKSSAVVQDPTL